MEIVTKNFFDTLRKIGFLEVGNGLFERRKQLNITIAVNNRLPTILSPATNPIPVQIALTAEEQQELDEVFQVLQNMPYQLSGLKIDLDRKLLVFQFWPNLEIFVEG